VSLKVSRLVWGKHIEPPAKKLVLLCFSDKCEDDGSRVFFYMRTLAAIIGLTHKSAQRYVSALTQEGLISATANGRGGAPGTITYYRVHVDRIAALPPIKRPQAENESARPGITHRPLRTVHRGPTVVAPLDAHAPNQCPEDATPVSQTGDAYEALNIPTHPLPVPDGNNDSQTKTKAQQLVNRLRKAGIAKAWTSHPLIAAVKLGANFEDMLAAITAAEDADAGNPFAYGVTVLLNRLHAVPATQTVPSSWEDAPASVVRARGAELGVLDQQPHEQWYVYKARVTTADVQRAAA
jgi:hypothetical protein